MLRRCARLVVKISTLLWGSMWTDESAIINSRVEVVERFGHTTKKKASTAVCSQSFSVRIDTVLERGMAAPSEDTDGCRKYLPARRKFSTIAQGSKKAARIFRITIVKNSRGTPTDKGSSSIMTSFHRLQSFLRTGLLKQW
ncbi:hypothetical protein DFH06DRAFT_748786 [Mycena polygramma]|nr:hypothetical protein DFH06DRAFT_748786 [Mycena polygramma]